MNIQQLRAQIAALQDATMDENKNFRTAYDEGKFDALTAVDNLLDSLQEEPVSVWHNMDEVPIKGEVIVVQTKDTFYGLSVQKGGTTYKNKNKDRYIKWAYASDLLNLSNVERTVKNWKEEPVSEELGEAANDYAHDLLHDDVFETFIAGAQWQKKKTLSDIKKAVAGKVFQFTMNNVEARGDDPNGKTVTLEGPVTFHINNPESIIDALIAL